MTSRIRIALAALALLATGCGASSYTVGRKVLASIATAEIAAGRAWARADDAKEVEIVKAARARGAFREDVQAEIDAWRAKSDKVDAALDSLAEATLAAKQGLDAAEAMKDKGFNLVAWVGPLYHAGVAVEKALRAAGVNLPLVTDMIAMISRFASAPPPPPPPPQPEDALPVPVGGQ